MPGILAVLWSGCLLSRSSNREVSSPFACTQCPVPYPAISLSGAPDRPGRVVDEIRPALLLSGATPNRTAPNQEFAPTRCGPDPAGVAQCFTRRSRSPELPTGQAVVLMGSARHSCSPEQLPTDLPRTKSSRRPGSGGRVALPSCSPEHSTGRPHLRSPVGSDPRRAPSDAPGAFAHRCGPDPAGVAQCFTRRSRSPELPTSHAVLLMGSARHSCSPSVRI